MLKRSFLLLLPVLFLAVTAAAGIKHYRSGVIVAAEVTKAKLNIAHLPPLAFPDLPPDRAYAVVSVKLDDMRELSIFDYSLGLSFQYQTLLKQQKVPDKDAPDLYQKLHFRLEPEYGW